MNNDKVIVVDINLTRGLGVVIAVGLLTISFLGYLAMGHEEAAASNTQSASTGSADLRQYYLTKDRYDGIDADTVCTQGYHFASLWEIYDPSHLKYNTDLGYTEDDSGQGPPTTRYGWIRTGYSSNRTGGLGEANCENWSQSDSRGTQVKVKSDWESGEILGSWTPYLSFLCSGLEGGGHVWCVED